MGSKWYARFFMAFYLALVAFCILGIIESGFADINVNTFFFVLLGLFGLPLLMQLLPTLEKFNLFGVEIDFVKKVETTEKRLRDFADTFEDRLKATLFDYVREESLSANGKKALEEFREEENER